MPSDQEIPLTDLLKSVDCIDVVSIQSAGRPIADKMKRAIGAQVGNFIRIRPTHQWEEVQVIEWVDGVLVPQHSVLVCDRHIHHGDTLNVVLSYLVNVGYDPRTIYACVKSGGDRFYRTRCYSEVRLVDY